jgi:hypothetical protein
MTTSLASVDPWPLPPAGTTTARNPPVGTPDALTGRAAPARRILGLLDDVALLALIALLFPVVILLAGLPVALLVRLVAAMVQWR